MLDKEETEVEKPQLALALRLRSPLLLASLLRSFEVVFEGEQETYPNEMTTPAVPSCSMPFLQPAQTALGPASTVWGSSVDASLLAPGVLGVLGRKASETCACWWRC